MLLMKVAGGGGPGRVDDVDDDGRECAREGVGDDGAGRGPGKDLDLTGRVQQHVAAKVSMLSEY